MLDFPCGIRPSRIVGGTEVLPNSIPWQVALVPLGQNHPFCGGTLIGSRHVLSAAHCTEAVSNFNVVVGEHNLTNENDGAIYTVESFYQHPSYDESAYSYDFVIIKLSERITLGDTAIHACLPTEELDDDYLFGKTLRVSGWGRLDYGGSPPMVLNQVDVPFVSNDVCKEKYVDSGWTIDESMMCAGNIENGSVGACQGDSGGKK